MNELEKYITEKREERRLYASVWREKNREKVRVYIRKYMRNRRKLDKGTIHKRSK